MLALLKNYIKTIFLSTDEISKEDQGENIMGVSKTNPYDYGVIHIVIGKSLTDLSDYSTSTKCVDIPNADKLDQDADLQELERISLNNYQEANVDLEEETMSLSIDQNIQSADFENLEIILNNGVVDDSDCLINASDTLGKLKGSDLYKSLQNNEEVRSRISQLLNNASLNNSEDVNTENNLLDMSEFLNM